MSKKTKNICRESNLIYTMTQWQSTKKREDEQDLDMSRPRLCAIEDAFARLGQERGTDLGQGDTSARQGLGEAR